MPIEKRTRIAAFFLIPAAFLLTAGLSLRAATIEVEEDEEDLAATPTPALTSPGPKAQVSPVVVPTQSLAPAPASPGAPPSQNATSQTSPSSSKNSTSPALENAAPLKRVRVSDNVGFYYFVKAGYVAESSAVPYIGKVVSDSDFTSHYAIPRKIFVDTTSDGVQVAPGDLLVVFRAVHPIEDSHTGSFGLQVENLAVIRVMDIQKRRCRVEILKSFRTFKEGDLVASYDREIGRWKQAQIKKPLPSHAVKCFVAGGEQGPASYNQMDFIYLSAGTKNGVVEGQNFRLWEMDDFGLKADPMRKPLGLAQVIFAGPTSSTARILNNQEPIKCGFEAEYQP